MFKRSVTVLVALVAVAAIVVFYTEVRQPRSPVHTATVSHVPANTGMTVKAAASGPAGAFVQRGLSQEKYDVLWKRYKPNTAQADGPMSRALLDNLAAITKNNTHDTKMLPAFSDVIYGRATALENRLNTGLRPDATIYLDYPYNAPVSLLDMAIKAGQRDIIQVLLQHGASVGPLTELAPDGTPLEVETPLPLAAANGEDDVVRLLLQSGANVDQRRALAGNDQTALAAAVYAQNVSTAYLLLTHGADINSALGPDGTVPPLLIPRYDSPRIAALRDLLIEDGAKMPSGQ